MITLESFLIFLSITTVFMVSPGPSVALAIRNGALYGSKMAAIAVLGNVVAFQILMMLSVMGLGAALVVSPVVFLLIKTVGALYLIYLGLKMIIQPVVNRQTDIIGQRKEKTALQLFIEAFLVTISNPKALIYITALLPQFVDLDRGSLLSVATLALTTALVQLSVFLAYATLAYKANSVLANSSQRRFFNCAGGVTFIGFGVLLGLAK